MSSIPKSRKEPDAQAHCSQCNDGALLELQARKLRELLHRAEAEQASGHMTEHGEFAVQSATATCLVTLVCEEVGCGLRDDYPTTIRFVPSDEQVQLKLSLHKLRRIEAFNIQFGKHPGLAELSSIRILAANNGAQLWSAKGQQLTRHLRPVGGVHVTTTEQHTLLVGEGSPAIAGIDLRGALTNNDKELVVEIDARYASFGRTPRLLQEHLYRPEKAPWWAFWR